MTRSIARLRAALRRVSRARRGPAVYVALSDGRELALEPDDRLDYVVDGLIGRPHRRPKKG